MVPWHTEKTESENNNEIAKFTSQSRQVMTQAPDIFEPWANMAWLMSDLGVYWKWKLIDWCLIWVCIENENELMNCHENGCKQMKKDGNEKTELKLQMK